MLIVNTLIAFGFDLGRSQNGEQSTCKAAKRFVGVTKVRFPKHSSKRRSFKTEAFKAHDMDTRMRLG